MCVKKNLFGIAKSVSFVVALTTGLTTVSAVFAPVVMAAEKAQQLSSKMKPLGEADKLMKEKKLEEKSMKESQCIPSKTIPEIR